jgi:CDP-4-dehydro-6-deoxyglucose reductase
MHTVTLQPSGLQFQVEDGEAVLAAALRHGFVLPYGCRNGVCGSCKGKILSGSVDYGVYQAKTLTEEEKAQGKALFCQAKPLSDLVLEARSVGAAKDIRSGLPAACRSWSGSRRICCCKSSCQPT